MKLTSLDSRGYGFTCVADVATYVARHGVDVLEREEVNTGFEIDQDLHWFQIWRQNERDKDFAERRRQDDERNERAVSAAERSAASAEKSARWAAWALLISIVALGIAVYQQFWPR